MNENTECYVCSYGEHAETTHTFWSVADANAYFRGEDKGRTFAYSDGTTTVEANFVNTYRPY